MNTHTTLRCAALAACLLAGLAFAPAARAEDKWNLDQKIQEAQAGNKWAAYDLWDAYYRGHHGVQRDPAKADKWLHDFLDKVWVVRFMPVSGFSPSSPEEFLARINHYAATYSGRNNVGMGSFFRTTRQGDKLIGSFLTVYPNELKAKLSKVPGLKVTSLDRITPEKFIQYEKSPQDSL